MSLSVSRWAQDNATAGTDLFLPATTGIPVLCAVGGAGSPIAVVCVVTTGCGNDGPILPPIDPLNPPLPQYAGLDALLA